MKKKVLFQPSKLQHFFPQASQSTKNQPSVSCENSPSAAIDLTDSVVRTSTTQATKMLSGTNPTIDMTVIREKPTFSNTNLSPSTATASMITEDSKNLLPPAGLREHTGTSGTTVLRNLQPRSFVSLAVVVTKWFRLT